MNRESVRFCEKVKLGHKKTGIPQSQFLFICFLYYVS